MQLIWVGGVRIQSSIGGGGLGGLLWLKGELGPRSGLHNIKAIKGEQGDRTLTSLVTCIKLFICFHVAKVVTPQHSLGMNSKGSLERQYGHMHEFFFFFVFLSFCLFAFPRATPMAYGGSQARGGIGAVAAGLSHSHSNAGSKPRL